MTEGRSTAFLQCFFFICTFTGMPDHPYTIVNNEKELQFEIALEGEKAYLSYRFYKKDIAFMHTTVPKALEGRGIASALAREAFRYAAARHKKVMVYCPFVAGFVKNHPEYRQQLDPEYHGHG
jgi:predicted GNAT family acetyltransferase